MQLLNYSAFCQSATFFSFSNFVFKIYPKPCFYLTFTEPTQIYRYLRVRNANSVSICNLCHLPFLYAHFSFCYFNFLPFFFFALQPIFLQRNLSYMQYRMSRSHKGRRNFEIDSILDRVSKSLVPPALRGGFMTITFLGFYDKKPGSLRNFIVFFLIFLFSYLYFFIF